MSKNSVSLRTNVSDYKKEEFPLYYCNKYRPSYLMPKKSLKKKKQIELLDCYVRYKSIKKSNNRDITRRVWDREHKNISRRQIIKLFGSWSRFKTLMEDMAANPAVEKTSLKSPKLPYLNTHKNNTK